MALRPMPMPEDRRARADRRPPRRSRDREASGYTLLRGNRSLVNVAFGPMKTSSPTRMPSQSCTPDLIVTRSPTTTSFSMKTWSQMLQSAPITAPGRTWANAQTRVPSPTDELSQMPPGCTKVTAAPSRPGPTPTRRRSRPDARRPWSAAAWCSRRPARRRTPRRPAPTGAGTDQQEREHERGVAGQSMDPTAHAANTTVAAVSEPSTADDPDGDQQGDRQVGEGEHAVHEVAHLAAQRPPALALGPRWPARRGPRPG